jgi:hypothetical protein
MMTEPKLNGAVGPVRWHTVVASGLIGAGVGWLGFAIPDQFGWPLPQIPLATALVIAVLAIMAWVLTWFTHRKIQVRRELIEASRAITLLALAKTSVVAGAGLAGAAVAAVVTFVPRMSAVLPRERVFVSVVAAIASVALLTAGIFWERACRIPGPPQGDAPKDLPRNANPSH